MTRQKKSDAQRDLRGLLAILVTLLTFGIAYMRAAKSCTGTLVPPWATGIEGAVITFYFMGRGGEIMRAMSRRREKAEEGQP